MEKATFELVVGHLNKGIEVNFYPNWLIEPGKIIYSKIDRKVYLCEDDEYKFIFMLFGLDDAFKTGMIQSAARKRLDSVLTKYQ